jgi:citrate lyase subunit beta/citryl-CoA lyase
MRSKLFVPGSRPELFEKALASSADGLSFDLEDAVQADRKSDARAAMAAFLRKRMAAQSVKVSVVRVNGIGTGLFSADLEAVAVPGLELISLPKVESASDIRTAADALARTEKACGLDRKIGLLATSKRPKRCDWRPRSHAPIPGWPDFKSATPICSSRSASTAPTRRRFNSSA